MAANAVAFAPAATAVVTRSTTELRVLESFQHGLIPTCWAGRLAWIAFRQPGHKHRVELRASLRKHHGVVRGGKQGQIAGVASDGHGTQARVQGVT